MEIIINQLPTQRAIGYIPNCSRCWQHLFHSDQLLQTWVARQHYIETVLKPYRSAQGELTTQDNLLLYNSRIVVPTSLQKETLQKLYTGHQGIERCRLAMCWMLCVVARNIQSNKWPSRKVFSVCETVNPEEWATSFNLTPWPSMIENRNLSVHNEWSELSTSRWLLLQVPRGHEAENQGIQVHFFLPQNSRDICDNGPQYTLTEFSEFKRGIQFLPHNQQFLLPTEQWTCWMLHSDNEEAAQRCRRSIHCTTLLNYCSTHLLWCNLSPFELLMGRSVRSCLRNN